MLASTPRPRLAFGDGPRLVATSPEPRACLQVLFSPDVASCGQVIPLTQQPLRIGRALASGTTISFEDKKLSRRHAEVTVADGGFVLVDLNSRNGTMVNGEPIGRRRLTSTDILRIGNTVLRFVAEDAGTPWIPPPRCPLVGHSVALRGLIEAIEAASATGSPVLMEGEMGSGKQLAATLLHQRASYEGAFVVHVCGRDDVEDQLRSSRGGTLYLDAVDALSPAQQRVLVRLLERSADSPLRGTRIVGATTVDLSARVQAGQLEPALYQHLASTRVRVPPLRERPEDLHPLVSHFLAEHGRGRYSIRADFIEGLALHHWPFNVRELRSLVRRLAQTLPAGGIVNRRCLPANLRRRISRGGAR